MLGTKRRLKIKLNFMEINCFCSIKGRQMDDNNPNWVDWVIQGLRDFLQNIINVQNFEATQFFSNLLFLNGNFLIQLNKKVITILLRISRVSI
jgi:hypothetical protein